MSKKVKIGDTMTASAIVTPVITPEIKVTDTLSPSVTGNPVVKQDVTPSGELELLKAQLAAQAITLAELQAKKPKGFVKQGLSGFEVVHKEVVKTLDAQGNYTCDILAKDFVTSLNEIARSESSANNYNGAKAELSIFKSALNALHERYTFVLKPEIVTTTGIDANKLIPVNPMHAVAKNMVESK